MTRALTLVIFIVLSNGKILAGPVNPTTDTSKLCKDLTGAGGVAALCDEVSKGVIDFNSTPACKDWSKKLSVVA